MALELIQRLDRHARNIPNAVAFREVGQGGDAGRSMTYGELNGSVRSVAAQIRRELPPDATLLICYPNQFECVIGFLGAIAAGATVFPLHPRMTDVEIVDAAERSRAAGIIGTARAVEAVRALGLQALELNTHEPAEGFDPDWSDRAQLLLQSSGTTGYPKIAQRSGPSLDAVARNVVHSVGLDEKDRVLGVVPACHSYGVECVVVGPVYAGSCVYLCQTLDIPLVMDQLAHRGITVFPGVPTIFEALSAACDTPLQFDHLRCAFSAGAILPREVFEAFHGNFGVRIGQLFGMTEVGAVTFNDPQSADHDPASVGLPMEGVRILVVDPDSQRIDSPLPPDVEGEVAISAPSMLTGYLREDDATCEAPPAMRDGYFLTGDLGRLDLRGRLTITGRLKLVVDVGGLKVNLLEVEQVLRGHESVDDCVVTPVSVSPTVLRLKALVIPRSGSGPSLDELRSYLRARLSAYKIPRTFELCDSLPRSPTGKVLRYRL